MYTHQYNHNLNNITYINLSYFRPFPSYIMLHIYYITNIFTFITKTLIEYLVVSRIDNCLEICVNHIWYTSIIVFVTLFIPCDMINNNINIHVYYA